MEFRHVRFRSCGWVIISFEYMIRLIDFLAALVGLILLLPLFIVLYLVGLVDTGSPLFRQERVGRGRRPFTLVKFCTMKKDTASVDRTRVQYGVQTCALPILWVGNHIIRVHDPSH